MIIENYYQDFIYLLFINGLYKAIK